MGVGVDKVDSETKTRGKKKNRGREKVRSKRGNSRKNSPGG